MPELILLAAIALLLMGVGRLAGPEPPRSTEDIRSSDARDYLDRLLGPAQDPVTADKPPQTTTPPPTVR
jgi:hypothetical protein